MATIVVVFNKVEAAEDSTNAINNNVVIMAHNKPNAATAGRMVRVVTPVICASRPWRVISVMPPLPIEWEETTKDFDGVGA